MDGCGAGEREEGGGGQVFVMMLKIVPLCVSGRGRGGSRWKGWNRVGRRER